MTYRLRWARAVSLEISLHSAGRDSEWRIGFVIDH
jgi:hypothetical protein